MRPRAVLRNETQTATHSNGKISSDGEAESGAGDALGGAVIETLEG